VQNHKGGTLRNGRISLQGQIYLLTSVTHNRLPVFNDFYIGRRLVNELFQENLGINTLCYVVMPDHLHWLLQLNGDLSLSQVMQRVKSKSGFYIKKHLNVKGPIWQSGFHDRALRKDEDVRSVARYVIANPLRAGLVDKIENYSLWDACWLESL